MVGTNSHTHDTGSSRYLYIGTGFSGYSNSFIDDVRIYNRALTTQDITDIYNDGLGAIVADDVDAPIENQSAPAAALVAGTTQTTLSIISNESATCKYGTTSGVSYGSMANTFTSSDGIHFSATVSVQPGHNYFYARCQDGLGNTNTSDFTADAQVYKTCTFTGVHDWYVDPDGDVLNCGTLNDPWDLETALNDNTDSI